MNILITGSAGFLGSHLVDRLILNNIVFGLDNLTTGSIKNVIQRRNNCFFNIGDVREKLNYKVDAIFNFACPASPPAYQKDPIGTFTTSVIGILNCIELAKNTGCKIIQASTSEVYGDPLVNPQYESYRGNVETTSIRSCYDEGKRGAETLLMDAKRMYGIDVRIIRIFNTYGPRMSLDDGRVVTNFIKQAIKNEPITIYGYGTQTRSFCYVDDLIDGIIKISELDHLDGPVNLGNPAEFTILDLAQKVIELTGSKSEIVYMPLPSDDPKQRKPDITLARQLIDFNPQIGLEDGLKRTIDSNISTLNHGDF